MATVIRRLRHGSKASATGCSSHSVWIAKSHLASNRPARREHSHRSGGESEETANRSLPAPPTGSATPPRRWRPRRKAKSDGCLSIRRTDAGGSESVAVQGIVTAQNVECAVARHRNRSDSRLRGKRDRPLPIAKGLRQMPTVRHRKAAPSNESITSRPEQLETYKDHGQDLLTLAMSWLAAHPVTASIAGASKPEQPGANVAAAGWKITPSNLAEIDAIVSKE